MDQSLTSQAYNYLREKLYLGEYQPGLRLDYKQLSIDIGISTTPVREAVGRLSSEGLVELVPRLGAVVRQMTPEGMLEIFQVREAIEPAAAAQASIHIMPSQLKELGETIDRMQSLKTEGFASSKQALPRDLLHKLLSEDLHFHMIIATASGNSWFVKILDDGQSLARLFHHERQAHTPQIVESTIHEHQVILEALSENNSERAADAMRKHIQSSRDMSITSRKLHQHPSWQSRIGE